MESKKQLLDRILLLERFIKLQKKQIEALKNTISKQQIQIEEKDDHIKEFIDLYETLKWSRYKNF